MRPLTVLLTLLLSASAVWAEVNAVISGPNTGTVGDLVVLGGASSTGDNHAWIVPPALEGKYVECGDNIAFATSQPGSYRFVLVVVDREAQISYASHVVDVTGTPVTEPGDPTEPTDPVEPGPPRDFSDLEKQSRELAHSLNDPVTAERLANGFLQVIGAVRTAPDIPAAQSIVRIAFEKTMLEREGASLGVDWLGQWRAKINDSLRLAADAGRIKTPPDYAQAIEAIVRGLQAKATVRAQPAAWVEFFTADNCRYCDAMVAETIPVLRDAGIKVVPNERHNRPQLPVVAIHRADGSVAELVGYQPASAIMQLIAGTR